MEKAMLDGKIAEASKTIFNYCLGKTRDRSEAEDLSQEILLELLKSAQNIRDENAFYGFMWAVAGNVYKQWCRKRQQQQTCELTEVTAATIDTYFEDENNDIYLLRRELSLLSQKYRRATILYYIERKSCAEIALLLSISESMVKYLLFKARTILKEGMNMERNLGQLSYNPKSLIPMYNGSGPNRFWDFMQSKIRQNIVSACYNDALTVQQISLETGIPLPYLDDEIAELVKYKILIQDGKHYQSNVIVISADCAEEINRAATKYHEKIADELSEFLDTYLDSYKKIGFVGSDFSDNTLRWQLAVLMFRKIFRINRHNQRAPITGWGENAFLWCIEKMQTKHMFSICGVDSTYKLNKYFSLYFFDYQNGGKGDHHDFFGKQRYIDIFCDICDGLQDGFSEYDLEVISELIRKGYVINKDGTFRTAIPIYSAKQYDEILARIDTVIEDRLQAIVEEMDNCACEILSAHTPNHLQDQVRDIAGFDKFVNAISIPATLLLERGVLHTDWHPLEMPTTFAVLYG